MSVRSLIYCLICLLAFFLMCALALAQTQPIGLRLSFFDKTYYAYGEPIDVSVKLANKTGSKILINKGFENTAFFMAVRIIDPSGRQIGAIRREPRKEFPDAPPVPVIYREGRHIRVAPWEVLSPDWEKISPKINLLDRYPLQLPGYYSAQVQVSAMIFKSKDPGNIHSFAWQGVLESKTKYFYFEGTTKVDVLPKEWLLKWKEDRNTHRDVKIQIWPQKGKKVTDYNSRSIRLNNLAARRVEVLHDKIEAFFGAREALITLGRVKAGRWYPVVLSGRLKSGRFFGGGRKVVIVR